jgi:hypothetical protein
MEVAKVVRTAHSLVELPLEKFTQRLLLLLLDGAQVAQLVNKRQLAAQDGELAVVVRVGGGCVWLCCVGYACVLANRTETLLPPSAVYGQVVAADPSPGTHLGAVGLDGGELIGRLHLTINDEAPHHPGLGPQLGLGWIGDSCF